MALKSDLELVEKHAATAQTASLPDTSYVSSLTLSNFRNYHYVNLTMTPDPVVLIGHNGAGKTNILEAVSLLTCGRGIRKAPLESLNATHTPNAIWSLHATLCNGHRHYSIGTAYDPERNKRMVKLDGNPLNKQADLADISTIIWLTPQMDGIFLESNSNKRRFMDRMVFHFDPHHSTRVNKYEHYMRERAKLLQQHADTHWIGIIEQNMAELSIAIAAARNDAITHIQNSINAYNGIFPSPLLKIEGDIEPLLADHTPALEIEEHICRKLFEYRTKDRLNGRTFFGAHKSTLNVFYEKKQMPAEHCSTGEQKALLLSIILAETKARSAYKNVTPILLLDEVVAHLDVDYRKALCDELLAIKAQCWLTGTDRSLFKALESSAQYCMVNNNTVAMP
ncbi:MAG: DNA replication/repair protein RecF [Rickettsiales bacterium]|nr:DNA replication/repair protein RecF [Rickettsiales bacterium]